MAKYEGNGKWKKILFISITVIILIVVLVILLISPIAKYLIEKNSVKYTGRQIRMSWLYLNPFTGYAHLSGVKIYEAESDSLFFTADGLSADFSVLRLFHNDYEITKVTIDKPWGNIIQNQKYQFNFDDLIERFTPKGKPNPRGKPLHLNILNIKINNGEFHYSQPSSNISYFIRKANLESTGWYWNRDTIKTQFSFTSGPATGEAKGNITINTNTLDYKLNTQIDKFDLHFIEQYVRDLANYGSFGANLDAHIKAEGSFLNIQVLKATGLIAINALHLGKTKGDDFMSFNTLTADIIELNPADNKFIFDSIVLKHPFLKYELYDSLDNIQRMFGAEGAGVASVNADPTRFNLILEIADYVKVLVSNFLHSYYKANKIAIYDGDLRYNDYTVHDKFSIDASPFTIVANSIDKSNKRALITMTSGIKPYGNVAVSLSVNPNDYGDFDQVYNLSSLPLPMFNPYLLTYTSFPLDRGTMDVNGQWNVRNGILQSTNHVIIVDPRVSKRLKTKDTKWLPVPIMMSIVRERGDVIDYEIPVSGNLKNPAFKLKEAIISIIKNILSKPTAVPYTTHLRHEEKNIEKALRLQWEMRQAELRTAQAKFIRRINDFLIDNPEASVDIYPQQYTDKEKEYILFFEAKKKYFLHFKATADKHLEEEDSEKIEKMSVKDTVFVRYITKQVHNPLLFTVQDKCLSYVGKAVVDAKYQELLAARKRSFNSFFDTKISGPRVHIHSDVTVIPFNGFSFYKIDYKGGAPDKLIKAYKDMEDLNNEDPRKKYKEKRKNLPKAGI